MRRFRSGHNHCEKGTAGRACVCRVKTGGEDMSQRLMHAWDCPCGTRNSLAFQTCRSCGVPPSAGHSRPSDVPRITPPPSAAPSTAGLLPAPLPVRSHSQLSPELCILGAAPLLFLSVFIVAFVIVTGRSESSPARPAVSGARPFAGGAGGTVSPAEATDDDGLPDTHGHRVFYGGSGPATIVLGDGTEMPLAEYKEIREISEDP